MFKTLLAFLGLASISFEDKKTTLTEEQFTTLEAKAAEAVASAETYKTQATADAAAIADLKAKAETDGKTIADLQARVAELEKLPGAKKATVVTAKDDITTTERGAVTSEENDFNTNLEASMSAFGWIETK